MMRALLLLLLIISVPAHAAEYGFLRVTVLEKNPQHTSNVAVRLNGKQATSFPHALSSPIEVEITQSMLAAGTATPLTSDYGALQSACQFEFTLQYSFDRAAWLPLGTFKAPTSAVNTAIPIGLCKGEVCSSNADIDKRIKEIQRLRWQQATQAVKKWLDDAFALEARLQREAREKLERNAPPAPDNHNVEQEVAQLSDEFGDQQMFDVTPPPVMSPEALMSARIDEAVEAGTTDRLLQNLTTEEMFYRSCAAGGPRAADMCLQYGGLAWLVATAEVYAVALSVDPAAAAARLLGRPVNSAQVGARMQSQLESLAHTRFQVQAALEAKRAQEFLAKAREVARMGIAFTPLNDAVDLCEAISGKVFCNPSGADLQASERFLAVLGVLGGDRLLWEEVRGAIYAGFRHPEAVAKAAEKIAANTKIFDEKGAAHVFFGDFEQGVKYTNLKGGAHMDDSIQSLMKQWESQQGALRLKDSGSLAEFVSSPLDGSAAHRYVDPNGVALYQFPRDRFNHEGYNRNAVEIKINGQDVTLKGAKTVFPAHWSADTIADCALQIHRSQAPNINGRRLGRCNGIDVALRMNAEKVETVYPIVSTASHP